MAHMGGHCQPNFSPKMAMLLAYFGRWRTYAHINLAEAVGSEHGHAGAAGDIVLPFVGVGMPVRFTQRAGLDLHERAGDGRRDWKLALRYQPVGAARISVRALRQQLVAMGERPAIEDRKSTRLNY